jgi:ribosomal protein S4
MRTKETTTSRLETRRAHHLASIGLEDGLASSQDRGARREKTGTGERDKRREGGSRARAKGGRRGDKGEKRGKSSSSVAEIEASKRGRMVETEGGKRGQTLDYLEGLDSTRMRVMNRAQVVHRQKSNFKTLYSGVKKSTWKALLAKQETRSASGNPSGRSVLAPLESRVDLVLWRSGRVRSRGMARHCIHQGHVSLKSADGLRDRVVRQPGLCLKPLDVLVRSDSRRKTRGGRLLAYWEKMEVSRPVPRYVLVDYALGRVCFQGSPLDGEVYRPVGMKRTIASLKDPFKK